MQPVVASGRTKDRKLALHVTNLSRSSCYYSIKYQKAVKGVEGSVEGQKKKKKIETKEEGKQSGMGRRKEEAAAGKGFSSGSRNFCGCFLQLHLPFSNHRSQTSRTTSYRFVLHAWNMRTSLVYESQEHRVATRGPPSSGEIKEARKQEK